jgi:hypothetical protein|eukprot:evm.model.NODE_13968_length_1816_cov_33.349117.1
MRKPKGRDNDDEEETGIPPSWLFSESSPGVRVLRVTFKHLYFSDLISSFTRADLSSDGKLHLKNVPVTDDAEGEEREKEEEEEESGVGVAAGKRKAAAEGKVEATARHAIAIRKTGRGATGLCAPRADNILRYCMLGGLLLLGNGGVFRGGRGRWMRS